MYVCACTYVCMYVHVRTYVCMYVHMYYSTAQLKLDTRMHRLVYFHRFIQSHASTLSCVSHATCMFGNCMPIYSRVIALLKIHVSECTNLITSICINSMQSQKSRLHTNPNNDFLTVQVNGFRPLTINGVGTSSIPCCT